MYHQFAEVETILSQAVPRIAPAIQLAIRHHGKLIYSSAYGYLDPDTRAFPTRTDTVFDMASVTKLFTTTAFMRLAEQGKTAIDQPVSQVLEAFTGLRPIRPYEDPVHWGQWIELTEPSSSQPGSVDAGQITFRQLLSHSSGLPAWRPFKDQPDAEAARQLALGTFFAYLPGMHVVYSDVGLILLGMAVERLGGQRLDQVIHDLVCGPLGLVHTRFRSEEDALIENAAPTELDQWRGRRVIGEVHDESASRLGGIAGHAGIFSTAEETARLGQSFLLGPSDVPRLLKPETIAEMTRLQAQEGETLRGLGFALRSADPESSGHPFSPQAFGHTGFTGTSVWIDPQRDLVVALLTNDVYHGREGRGILPLRVLVHKAVVEAIDQAD